MPNWCSNTVIVEGKKKDVKKFMKEIESEHEFFDFNKVIPYPQKFQELDDINQDWWAKYEEMKDKGIEHPRILEQLPPEPESDGYNQGGYEWCTKNWGTKWNASDVERGDLECDRKSGVEICKVDYTFETAWSPPRPVIEQLSKKYPDLFFHIEYIEEGAAYRGHAQMMNGKILEDVEEMYVPDEDED